MSREKALTETKASEPLGLAAFDSLRAEDEPWLAQCYVAPPDFALMTRWRSILVFGDEGAGKTALRLALERAWAPPRQAPRALVVRWPFAMVENEGLRGTQLVRAYREQVLNAVARAIVDHVLRFPPDRDHLPCWVGRTLAWFLHRFLQGNLEDHLESLRGESSDEGFGWLRDVLAGPVRDAVQPSSPPAVVVGEIVKALNALGLEGVHITVDDLEPWCDADPSLLADQLGSFLQTLGEFERPHFAYALMLPSELDSKDLSCEGVVRRRVDVYRLEWNATALETMTERRLALAFGEESFPLNRLGPTERLRSWLRGCGGQSPRGWLATLGPFVARFLSKAAETGQMTPLTEEECIAIQGESAPRLYIDPKTDEVFVGWRKVSEIQPADLKLLKYLYVRRGELCQRWAVLEEYLRITEQLFRIDDPKRERLLDQPMYRLRQAIEPDPDHPVFLTTVRGGGFRLDNAW